MVKMKTNDYWLKEDKHFEKFEKKIKIPQYDLKNVNYIILKNKKDFEKIPKSKGVYWIWTNEKIKHCLHAPLKNLPKKISLKINNKKIKGEIIYNGVAQDNINYRIKKYHLQSDPENTISGISIDIYTEGTVISHKKKVYSTQPRAKVPYINKEKIKTKKDALKLFLSNTEKKFIIKSKEKNIYFRNGIDIFDEKHKKYCFVVFYIGDLKSESYMGFIEKQWRRLHNSPRLCSYISGR